MSRAGASARMNTVAVDSVDFGLVRMSVRWNHDIAFNILSGSRAVLDDDGWLIWGSGSRRWPFASPRGDLRILIERQKPPYRFR